MLNKEKVKQIILDVIEEIIPEKDINSLEEPFISNDSIIESIEIAQIIVRIEELILENEVEGYDLFERIFENEKLTFNELVELIYKDLSELK